MKKFTYKAKNAEGKLYDGELEAENRFDVYTAVRKDGGTIISVSEGGAKGLSTVNINKFLSRFSGVKITEKIIFSRNLSAMLKAGLAVSRALDVLERQTKNLKFKSVIQSVKANIAKGDELHAAMDDFPDVFPPLMVSMVRAGEESGKLTESLALVSDQMDRVYQMQRKIKGAMIYPAIIVAALIGVGALMMIYIVPTLSQTFEELGVELPLSTTIIIGISDFLVDYTIVAFGLLVLVIVGVMYGLRTVRGQHIKNSIVIRIPMIKGIVKESNAARTTRTLASLLSSGVQVVQAFQITEDVVQNHHFRSVLSEARMRVQKGETISSVFAEHEDLYPPLVGELIAVGEETGKLPDMLLEVAEFYEGEVEQKTKNMSTFIEPFLMLVVGAAVGFFAVSMITPIYSVSTGF